MIDIWIDKHDIGVGQFIGLIKEGDIISDNLYDIPAAIAKIDDEHLFTMAKFGILNVYGVMDEHGMIHMNSEDVDRIKTFVDSATDARDKRQRNYARFNFLTIDYKTPENVKHTFWKEIL